VNFRRVAVEEPYEHNALTAFEMHCELPQNFWRDYFLSIP